MIKEFGYLHESKCYSGFEDCNLSVIILFIVCRVTTCDTNDEPDKAFTKFLHAFAL